MSERIKHLFELTEEDLKQLLSEFFKKYQFQQINTGANFKDDLMPRKEVALFFGISLVTLAKWKRLKIIPNPIKKGGKVFYLRSQINQCIAPKQ